MFIPKLLGGIGCEFVECSDSWIGRGLGGILELGGDSVIFFGSFGNGVEGSGAEELLDDSNPLKG
jgi:hypothetical protein